MRRQLVLFFVCFALICKVSLSQNIEDSLVYFSDLKFHSEFEKNCLVKPLLTEQDTFNRLLAIYEDITEEKAEEYYARYKEIFPRLEKEKIAKKKGQKKIQTIYSSVHKSVLLGKYQNSVYFPDIFISGNYNCVAGSLLYAMVFQKLHLPISIKVSQNHVYLIANPGKNSMVVETTNPLLANSLFTSEYKKQYVTYLRNTKQISEYDYKNKSVEEIFSNKYYNVREMPFSSVYGLQYNNKAIEVLNSASDYRKALYLAQKAYYYFPDDQLKVVLLSALNVALNACDYSRIEDIDILAQALRFDMINKNNIALVFNGIIISKLDYDYRKEYCDSLYNRLISKISDEAVKNEISYNYYVTMAYRMGISEKLENYALKALEIKRNSDIAKSLLLEYIESLYKNVNDEQKYYEIAINNKEKYKDIQCIQPELVNREIVALLKLAYSKFTDRRISEGKQYIQKFKDISKGCVLEYEAERWVGRAYFSWAAYYYNKKKDLETAGAIVKEGLKIAEENNDLLNLQKAILNPQTIKKVYHTTTIQKVYKK